MSYTSMRAVFVFISIATIGVLSVAVSPAYADLDINDPMTWLVKSVCADAKDHATSADPYYGCPAGTSLRKLRVGEPLPYHNVHAHGQLQQHDTFPISSPSGTLVLAPFDFPPMDTYNLYQGSDGYDIYRIQGNWVTALNTSDGGGYGTTFFSSGCTVGGGWNFFPKTNFLSAGQSTDKISGVYWEQSGSSFPGACPSGYSDSLNSWQLVKGYAFGVIGKPTKTMDAIVSTHGYEPNDIAGFKQHGHLEVFYFTKEYGITRWEVWTPTDQNPTKTSDCTVPTTSTYQGITFVISACRDWSTVTPVTSSAIPLWPIPNMNLLSYPHFDNGGFDDSTQNLQLWHRFGKSPAGNLINWSTRNSTVASDQRYSSTGVRYLSVNCGAGSDGQCGTGGSQAIYQDLPISMFSNTTYGYGVSIRSEGGTGTFQAALQEIDSSGHVIWQDVAQDTHITSDNGPDQNPDQPKSVYLSSKFVGKTVTIPILSGAVKIRFLMLPINSPTFDILTSWLAPYPVASYTVTPVTQAGNDSSFVSQQVPSTMTAGQSYPITITLKNTGTTTWTSASNYRLGAITPLDNFIWGKNRVNLQSSVAPASNAVFSFSVTAPTTTGNYTFQWRMVQEAVQWFGTSTPGVQISVVSAIPSTPSAIVASSVSNTQSTLSWTASIGGVAPVSYRVYRNGSAVATTTTNTYADSGLQPATVYSYSVSAIDAAGHTTPQSNQISVITSPFATSSLAINGRISTIAAMNIRANSSITATILGTAPKGTLGTIIAGPASANGYIWWKISYDTGTTGWSIAPYLSILYTTTSPLGSQKTVPETTIAALWEQIDALLHRINLLQQTASVGASQTTY